MSPYDSRCINIKLIFTEKGEIEAAEAETPTVFIPGSRHASEMLALSFP